jgi:hypothetical protein
MIFFAPVAMMMERKKSGFFLTLHFFLIHSQVLLFLVMVNHVFALDGKAFLGSRHVVLISPVLNETNKNVTRRMPLMSNILT